MKIIVGVDRKDQYVQALRMIARLSFLDLKLWLVHVREEDELRSENLMREAEAAASELDLTAVALEETGDPSKVLSRLAHLERADIIAIGSNEKGPMLTMLTGSTGRRLLLDSPDSLLVAKGHVKRRGALRCVIGYDGSETCDDGLTRFCAWAPRGISHADVLYAVSPVSQPAAIGWGGYGMPVVAGPVMMDDLQKVAARGGEKIRLLHCEVTTDAVVGDPLVELRQAMTANDGDLLVLPSKQHSWLERFAFGSTSLAEVTDDSVSVLVVR
jgi:nucleotide-binding universal stress UspA family protein